MRTCGPSDRSPFTGVPSSWPTIRSTGVSYSVISEFLNPYNEAFNWSSVTHGWSLESTTGLAMLSDEVERQASMIGYINAFYVFSAFAISVIPFIPFLKRPDT